MMKRNDLLWILFGSALLFLPFLGSVNLFDWDEVNFAECGREMLITGDVSTVQLNYRPFWEKPPLFIWLSAISMKLFGVNEFGARFPDAACGILTLLLLYWIGARERNRKFGLLWALCYVGSTLPQFYFHSGIIDPWFNLFIFLGVYFLYRAGAGGSSIDYKKVLASGAMIGLALLTKGPAAVVVFGATVGFYLLFKKFKTTMNAWSIVLLLLTICVVGGTWFGWLLATGKGEVIEHFISYQVHLFGTEDSGHGGPFYYHVVVLLIGCFPASMLAMASMFKSDNMKSDFSLWMKILFWVVLVLFSVVKTKIIHYSSLCYFPLTFLAANTLVRLSEGGFLKKWWLGLTWVIGGVFGLVILTLPLAMKFKSAWLSPSFADPFTVENLMADVKWTGFEGFGGLLILAGLIWLSLNRNDWRKWAGLLSANTLATVVLCWLVAPKIEYHTQGVAIGFYKEKAKERCYVSALGYHSYAQYYYGNRQPEADPQRTTTDWMLSGELDRPAYFVSKITDVDYNKENYPFLIEIGRKNGYVFYRRDPGKLARQ